MLGLAYTFFSRTVLIPVLYNNKCLVKIMHVISSASELVFFNDNTTVGGCRGMFQWKETVVNTTTSTSCMHGPPGVMATRHCVSRDMWEPPSASSVHCTRCNAQNLQPTNQQFCALQQVMNTNAVILSVMSSWCIHCSQENVTVNNVDKFISNVTNIIRSARIRHQIRTVTTWEWLLMCSHRQHQLSKHTMCRWTLWLK